MKNNHLKNNDFINYLHHLNEIDKNEIIRIENHLIIDRCQICNDKIKDLKSMHSIRSTLANNQKPEIMDNNLDICPNLNHVDEFVQNTMNQNEKVNFRNHLSTCEICREAVSVLFSTDALAELKSDNQDEPSWLKVKEGIIRLNNAINLSLQNGFNLIQQSIAVPAIKLRSTTDSQDKPLIIDLPDNKGSFKIFYTNKSPNNGQIRIELPNNSDQESLIEIFNDKNLLIKSVEDSKIVTLPVTKGIYKIILDNAYEISLNID